MKANLIDGRKIADQFTQSLRKNIHTRIEQGKQVPGLAVILTGEDPASQIYVQNKRKTCEKVGIRSVLHHLPAHTDQATLLDLITTLNADPTIHGILVQLPLPDAIDPNLVLKAIDPQKDVDGFHPSNMGTLAQRKPALRPCTPWGIIKMLEHIGYDPCGQHGVVVGASNIVGRPMALELLLVGTTVTICHRFTRDLKHHVTQADLLVCAVGKPHFIPGDWIKPGAVVIDVGMNRDPAGHLVGDIDFVHASQRASWITPVPGGVGPMTVAMLLNNTFQAAQSQDP